MKSLAMMMDMMMCMRRMCMSLCAAPRCADA